MIKIEIPDSLLLRHRAKYYNDIEKILAELKTGKRYFNYTPKKAYFQKFYDLFIQYDILIAQPEKLKNFIIEEEQLVKKCWGGHRPSKVNDIFLEIFSYKSFSEGKYIDSKNKAKDSEWDAWTFLKGLNISVCPYCNADTVFASIVLKKGKGAIPIRSALDHYYPKSKYPFFAISLYNLVPSCDRCNSKIKERREMHNYDTTHPYADNFHDGIRFSKKILTPGGFYGNPSGFELELVPNDKDLVLADKAKNMAKFFSISEVYNSIFKREAAQIIEKINFCVNSYRSTLKPLGLSDEELDNLMWGDILDPSQINRNRLSKMTIDLRNEKIDSV